MPRLTLDLPQAVIDALNEIAVEAREPAFASQDAKGMLEFRLKRETRERRVALAVDKARREAETIL